MLFTDAFVDGLTRFLTHRRLQREHRHTIDAVSALPAHIRKDIGWPGAYERQRIFRR